MIMAIKEASEARNIQALGLSNALKGITKTQPVVETQPVAITPPVKTQRVRITQPVVKTDRGDNYTGSIITTGSVFATLAPLGLLFVLNEILPSGEGWVKVGRLAKALRKAKTSVLSLLAQLENNDCILTLETGQKGRYIEILTGSKNTTGQDNTMGLSSSSSSVLRSLESLKTTTTKGGSDNATGSNYITGSNYLTRSKNTISKKQFFAICLFLGKSPEEYSDQVVGQYIQLTEDKGREFAMGFFLTFLPQAKTSPAGYLLGVIQNKGVPAPAKIKTGEKILNALEGIQKKVGEEILPDQWLKSAHLLKVQVNKSNILPIQERLIKRLKVFATLQFPHDIL